MAATIVVGYDAAPAAQRALDRAIDEAKEREASLVIVAVAEFSWIRSALSSAGSHGRGRRAPRRRDARYGRCSPRPKRESSPRGVRRRVRVGDRRPRVGDRACSRGSGTPSWIVLGHHHHRWLGRVLGMDVRPNVEHELGREDSRRGLGSNGGRGERVRAALAPRIARRAAARDTQLHDRARADRRLVPLRVDRSRRPVDVRGARAARERDPRAGDVDVGGRRATPAGLIRIGFRSPWRWPTSSPPRPDRLGSDLAARGDLAIPWGRLARAVVAVISSGWSTRAR